MNLVSIRKILNRTKKVEEKGKRSEKMKAENLDHRGEEEMEVRDGNKEGVSVDKVMTDEQIETLRKQIVAYTIISKQLRWMYNALSSQYLAETSSFYSYDGDLCQRSSSHMISSRHRWNPTPAQLQILEYEFGACNGSPGKQKIKEITAKLAEHSQISETSVYNWFQNRRARLKRKKSVSESENAETPNGNNQTRMKKPEFSKLLVNAAPTTSKAGNRYFSADIGNQMFR